MGRLMAIQISGDSKKAQLKGERPTDPAFKMPATWIVSGDRERAELLGHTVVDPATVVTTQLTEVLKSNAAELLGRAEAQELVDAFAMHNAKLVEEVIPNLLPLGDVIRVLKNLLRENVSVRDLRTILETLADYASTVKDPDALTEKVRVALGRQLTARYLGANGKLPTLMLSPEAEMVLRGRPSPKKAGSAAGPNASGGPNLGGGAATFDPSAVHRVIAGLERALAGLDANAHEPVVVCAADLRRTVATLAARHAPGLAVLSYAEIDPRVQLESLGAVGLSSAAPAVAA